MQIGELSEQTGLPASRIRFYEAQGLIGTVVRRANGYREYLPRTAQILEIIVTAQAGGFSLEEIRSLLPTPGSEKWDKHRLVETLKRKVSDIDLLLARLQANRGKLLEVIEQVANANQVPCEDNARNVMQALSGAANGKAPSPRAQRPRRPGKTPLG